MNFQDPLDPTKLEQLHGVLYLPSVDGVADITFRKLDMNNRFSEKEHMSRICLIFKLVVTSVGL